MYKEDLWIIYYSKVLTKLWKYSVLLIGLSAPSSLFIIISESASTTYPERLMRNWSCRAHCRHCSWGFHGHRKRVHTKYRNNSTKTEQKPIIHSKQIHTVRDVELESVLMETEKFYRCTTRYIIIFYELDV